MKEDKKFQEMSRIDRKIQRLKDHKDKIDKKIEELTLSKESFKDNG